MHATHAQIYTYNIESICPQMIPNENGGPPRIKIYGWVIDHDLQQKLHVFKVF